MNGCIEWDHALNAYGYGVRVFHGRYWLVHRLAWTQQRGPIPDGLCVLHRCDNRRCYNVDHLFLGTKADNNRDCAAKGRHVGNRKITADQYAAIQASTERTVDLARQMNVCTSTIYRIRRLAVVAA